MGAAASWFSFLLSGFSFGSHTLFNHFLKLGLSIFVFVYPDLLYPAQEIA